MTDFPVRLVDLVRKNLVQPLVARILVLETLAEVEHRQWMHWSQHVAEEHDLPDELLEKWEENWVPYEELEEETKESDRKWALEAMDAIEDVAEVSYRD